MTQVETEAQEAELLAWWWVQENLHLFGCSLSYYNEGQRRDGLTPLKDWASQDRVAGCSWMNYFAQWASVYSPRKWGPLLPPAPGGRWVKGPCGVV